MASSLRPLTLSALVLGMAGLCFYNSNTPKNIPFNEIKQQFVQDQPLPKEVEGRLKEDASSTYEKDKKFKNLVDIVHSLAPTTFAPRSYVSDIPDFQPSPSVELKKFAAELRMPKIGINTLDRSINKEKSKWQERFMLTLPGEPPQQGVLGGALKEGEIKEELFAGDVLP